jgi:hypothetical protein
MSDVSIIHFKAAKAGRKRIKARTSPSNRTPAPERIPRISRLMALAIHFEVLIRQGKIRDYADLARLGGFTRARITQIMNLLNLSPEIQEKLLFLQGMSSGRDSMSERNVRSICREVDWIAQRNLNGLAPKNGWKRL